MSFIFLPFLWQFTYILQKYQFTMIGKFKCQFFIKDSLRSTGLVSPCGDKKVHPPLLPLVSDFSVQGNGGWENESELKPNPSRQRYRGLRRPGGAGGRWSCFLHPGDNIACYKTLFHICKILLYGVLLFKQAFI